VSIEFNGKFNAFLAEELMVDRCRQANPYFLTYCTFTNEGNLKTKINVKNLELNVTFQLKWLQSTEIYTEKPVNMRSLHVASTSLLYLLPEHIINK